MTTETAHIIVCTCGQKMKIPHGAKAKIATCVACGEKINISDKNSTPVEDTSSAKPSPAEKSPDKTPAKTPTPKKSASKPVNNVDTHIIDQLLENNLLKKKQVEEAKLVQQDLKRNLWEIIVDIGHVSEESLQELMQSQGNYARIDLANYNIPKDVIQFVPPELARSAVMFPVDKLGKLLTLVVVCPLDETVITEVAERTGLKVKVMLSSLAQVRACIQEYYPEERADNLFADPLSKNLLRDFKEIISSCEVAARIFDIETLPVQQGTIKRLDELANGGMPLPEVTEAVNADPTAALRLLRVSNSAAYGMPKRVDNIPLSVTLLGGEGVRQVLSYSDSIEDGPDLGEGFQRLAQRALFCSKASAALASAAGIERNHLCATAGLLFELGRIALMHSLPHSYPTLTKGKNGQELRDEEKRLYQFDHVEAGYMIARKWNLPPGITEPIRYLHDPDSAEKSTDIVKIVALASRVLEAHFAGSNDPINEASALIESFKLNQKQVSDILSETAATL